MSARPIGIEIGVQESESQIRSERILQEPTNVDFVEADNCYKTRSNYDKQCSAEVLDVAFVKSDGDDQNQHNRHRLKSPFKYALVKLQSSFPHDRQGFPHDFDPRPVAHRCTNEPRPNASSGVLSEEISGEYNGVWPIHPDYKVVTVLGRLRKEAVWGLSSVPRMAENTAGIRRRCFPQNTAAKAKYKYQSPQREQQRHVQAHSAKHRAWGYE